MLVRNPSSKGCIALVITDCETGTNTCAGYAGSLGHEAIDARTFSEWGLDYLKYDNCYVPDEWADEYTYNKDTGVSNAPAGYDWSTSNSSRRYHAMRDELLKQNRTIQFSMCIWGEAKVQVSLQNTCF
jgi:alpha-galactosidase